MSWWGQPVMHRPQRVHSSDRKASRARPRVTPCDRTSARRARYRARTRSVRSADWWQRSGWSHQGKELAEVVLLSGQGHLTQGGAVMGLHVGPRDRPSLERSLGEGHDLGAPDVREAPIGPGHHRRVGGSQRLDPCQLPDVTEGKVGAVGPLLRQSSTSGRNRLPADALDIGRRPLSLVRGRESIERRPEVRFEGAPHVDDRDLLRGIGRESQSGTRRAGTRSDDQRCRHGQLRWTPTRTPFSPTSAVPWRPKVGIVATGRAPHRKAVHSTTRPRRQRASFTGPCDPGLDPVSILVIWSKIVFFSVRSALPAGGADRSSLACQSGWEWSARCRQIEQRGERVALHRQDGCRCSEGNHFFFGAKGADGSGGGPRGAGGGDASRRAEARAERFGAHRQHRDPGEERGAQLAVRLGTAPRGSAR